MRLIDAEALIQSVGGLLPKKMPFDYDENDNELGAILYEVKKVIDNQPTIGRWIPCSERLPKEGENVLVCLENKTYDIAFYSTKDCSWLSSLDEWCYSRSVIAWMPLPEPYKEADGCE